MKTVYHCNFEDFILVWTKNNKDEHLYPGPDMLFFYRKNKGRDYIEELIQRGYSEKEVLPKQLFLNISEYIIDLENIVNK
jgi:hypothetical protein